MQICTHNKSNEETKRLNSGCTCYPHCWHENQLISVTGLCFTKEICSFFFYFIKKFYLLQDRSSSYGPGWPWILLQPRGYWGYRCSPSCSAERLVHLQKPCIRTTEWLILCPPPYRAWWLSSLCRADLKTAWKKWFGSTQVYTHFQCTTIPHYSIFHFSFELRFRKLSRFGYLLQTSY